MREIKFRAWDKRTKQIVDVESVGRQACSIWVRTLPDGDWTEESVLPSEIDLMQFTSLHDKEGKEIFEGDVLEKNYGLAEPLMVGDKEKLADRWSVEFFRGQFVMNRIGLGYSERLSDFAEERAVIGDIYSNPELITSN